MGSAYSRRKPVGKQTKPSRHAWEKIQDVNHVDSDDEVEEDDEWWIGDRRYVVDERSDWPRSCPVLHLNIQEDFPLDAQRRLVRSVYRFWLFSWWISVINFVAVMATLLTSNVTNAQAMILSFMLSIIYLFVVFIAYFRPLYWALRLESTIMFLWFYLFTVILVAFFIYQVSTALGLISILASPLAPGSQLPVKVNPIFPVILLSMVAIFYLFSFVLAIYYFISAFKWHMMKDKDKLKLFKKQKKQSWLAPWYGGGGGDPLFEDVDDDGSKPRYVYSCTISYEKFEDDYVDDFEDPMEARDPNNKNNKKKKKKKKKRKKTSDGRVQHEMLTIPGRMLIFPPKRKIEFRADEAIFNNVFTITVLFINIASMANDSKKVLNVTEKINDSIPEEERGAFHTFTATCASAEATTRLLKFEFDTKQDRDECKSKMDTIWKGIMKKEQLYVAQDAQKLQELRLSCASKARERAAQHLLTHRDWKLLVSFVWRKKYQSGDIIIPKGASFSDILHVTSGTVAIFLETSESVKDKEKELDDDFDLQQALFPAADLMLTKRAPTLEQVPDVFADRSVPRYFTVRFNKRKLGFSYRKKERSYSLKAFTDARAGKYVGNDIVELYANKRTFKNNIAAIVHSVKPGSEADRNGIKVGDELVKVGLYDIEANELPQKSITNLVKNHSYPMTMEFRRPPNVEFQTDQTGFIAPDPLLVPQVVRDQMDRFEHDVEQDPARVVLTAPRPLDGNNVPEEGRALLNYETSSEEEVDDEDDYYNNDNDYLTGENSRNAGNMVAPIGIDDDYLHGFASPQTANASRMRHLSSNAGGASTSPQDLFPARHPMESPPAGPGGSAPSVPGAIGGGPGSVSNRNPQSQALADLELAERYATEQAEQMKEAAAASGTPTGSGSNAPPLPPRDEMFDNTTVEFDAREPPTIDELVNREMGRNGLEAFELENNSNGAAQKSGTFGRMMERGHRFLFGTRFSYDKIEEERLRKQLGAAVAPQDELDHEDDDFDNYDASSFAKGSRGSQGSRRFDSQSSVRSGGALSIIIEGDSDDDDTASDNGSLADFFDKIHTFEPVGTFERGDTIGVIPWILNQPVTTVQLEAKTDVVIHSIMIQDLTKLLRKNATLALAFFKYVAAVIGERADRDEELLIEEIEENLLQAEKSKKGNTSLTRLLDNKPIRSNQETGFDEKAKELEKARSYFEQDFDMAFDSIIFTEACEIQIVGDITVLIGESVFGVDTAEQDKYNEPKEGVLYVTHYHLCFKTKKRVLDLAKLKRRPTLFGKIHLDDIYEMRRFGEEGEHITIVTDEVRLDLRFQVPGKSLYVEDWIRALLRTGTIVEKAPHSYTLPGDIYGFSSGTEDKNMPETVAEDPLNIVYTQQKDLRMEFLILTQTLQQVLTKQDRFKLFREGRSVTLKRGQNVITASKMSAGAARNQKKRSSRNHDEDDGMNDEFFYDPGRSKRITTSKKANRADGPNGLYLVGKGELVVQREVNGRRVQFASYRAGTVFGVERFLTGAPSPFTIKVSSSTALLKFAPRDRTMALLRSDLSLAARFYQYCSLLQMQRLRGPILTRPRDDEDDDSVVPVGRGTRGCTIL